MVDYAKDEMYGGLVAKVRGPLRLLASVLRLTEQARFEMAEQLSFALVPQLKFPEPGKICFTDEEFRRAHIAHADYGNWHAFERQYMVRELLNLVGHLPGAYVECGVYRGATAYWLCEAARREQKNGGHRAVHLFDSWQGLPEPGEKDGGHWSKGKFACTVEDTKRTLRGFEGVTSYHPGWFKDTFLLASLGLLPITQVAFLHIDVDLYESTKECLEFFYPRMARGGIIVDDEYGFAQCPGAKLAMDEFFADKPERIAALPTAQGLVIKQ